MWTLISSINFRATKRRVARPVVTATVVLGTLTQVALALLPQPAVAAPDPCETWQAEFDSQLPAHFPDVI